MAVRSESELERVRCERDELRREKEEEVAALDSKLHAMERSYDAILQVHVCTCVYTAGTCICTRVYTMYT